jgi:hypothetical protein
MEILTLSLQNYDEGELARKRKSGYDDRRKKLGKAKKDAEQAEDTGMSIGSKDKEMEHVEKKLQKTAVRDALTMVESDSDEDIEASKSV